MRVLSFCLLTADGSHYFDDFISLWKIESAVLLKLNVYMRTSVQVLSLRSYPWCDIYTNLDNQLSVYTHPYIWSAERLMMAS